MVGSSLFREFTEDYVTGKILRFLTTTDDII